MNQVWLQIFATMIGGSVIKTIVPNVLVWVVVDLAIMGIAYLILRRNSVANIKSSMLFLGLLTVVSVLTDLQIMSDTMSGVFVLAIVGWMMFMRSRRSNGNGNSKDTTVRHKWHK